MPASPDTAQDLWTFLVEPAREVVGRILKRWDRSSWVRLQRGAIRALDLRALHDFAGLPQRVEAP